MSNNNSTLETAIKRAALSGFTVQQTVGESKFPYRIIGPAVTLDGLAEVLDLIDQHRFDKPDDTVQCVIRGNCDNIRKLAAGTDGEVLANRLCDEMESSLEPEQTGLNRHQYALIVDTEGAYSLVSGISGIADALNGPLFDDINDEISQNLVIALKRLTDRLYEGVYGDHSELEDKVRNAIEGAA